MVDIVEVMVVILHILIAVSSIILATAVFLKPNRSLLQVSYGFIAATLASGVYLVWVAPTKMLHVCVSGLLYTLVVVAITAMAHSRFAQLQKREQE